jgi:hypothetical protein
LQKIINGKMPPSVKPLPYTTESTRRQNAKLLAFMIAAALFFGMTLLISFFLVIVAINAMDIPGDVAPNIFMLGLVPPSIGTFLLFRKVFDMFM